MLYKVNGYTANVRAGPQTTFPTVGGLRQGDVVEVASIQNGWAALKVQWAPSQKGWIGLYIFAGLLDPIDTAPVQPSSSLALGVNVLGNHRPIVDQLLGSGCPSYVIFQAPDVASYVKDRNPNAVVIVRPWLNNAVPTIDRYLELVGGAKDPRLIYTCFNEGDELDQNRPDTLALRAKIELEYAAAVRNASGATFAAGSFSVGNPDITNPRIADAIKSLYRDAFRDGTIWMDHHLYSPRLEHIYNVNDLQWYETRIVKYYELCGFDPQSLGKHICTETGEDEGGVGGFLQHSRTSTEVSSWARSFISAYQQPISVGGVSFKIPLVAANIFAAAGGSEKWKGYDIMPYVPTLKEDIWTARG